MRSSGSGTTPDIDTVASVGGAMLALIQNRERENREILAGLACAGKVSPLVARQACRRAAAYAGCAFRGQVGVCARSGLETRLRAVLGRLRQALVRERERRPLVEHFSGEHRLLPTHALGIVRAWLGVKGSGSAEDARSVRPNTCLLAMCGPPGVGKTLAACYALALHSGRYVTSYGLARPEVEVDVLARPKLLVIDQLGREYSGRSDYALSRLEELLDERYAQLRKTILVGNLLEKQFRDRYDIIIGDRFRGDGQYVAVSGESLRGRSEGGDCATEASAD